MAPRLLVLGHVTRDEISRDRSAACRAELVAGGPGNPSKVPGSIGGQIRLGGAASYAALAAARLGVETALVTVAPPDDPLLAPLRRAPRLVIHCVPSPVMTTFALDYTGPRRRLTLRRTAAPLRRDDVPPAWRDAAVTYVGPVAG